MPDCGFRRRRGPGGKPLPPPGSKITRGPEPALQTSNFVNSHTIQGHNGTHDPEP